MNQDEFLQAFENYRYGVMDVLPGYISGRFVDTEALADELELVLYSRDILAQVLASTDPFAQTYLDKIDALDCRLLEIKDRLLSLIPFYPRLRQHRPRPRSQWWYYLDEITPFPQAQLSTVSYWLPLAPLPASAS